MIRIEFDMIIFKEDVSYVSYCPEFDISSCGKNVEHAKKMLKTAIRLFLEEAEFECVRIEGDHHVYAREGVVRPVVIPDWPEVPVFIIKNNVRTVGISRERYLQLLEKVK